MSHEWDSGYSVRQPAWHGLATVTDGYQGKEESKKLAGHCWLAVPRDLYVPVGGEQERTALAHGQPIAKVPGWKAVVRDDRNTVIGVVRDGYEIVQNEVLWDLIDQLVQEPNVQYETAGCLKGGSVLWVLAKLHEPVQIKGDNTAILPYVIVSTAHDGSQSLEAAALDVRVICWNTFVAGRERARSAGTTYRFRHTKNVMDRVESAREALGLVRNSFRVFVDMMNELAEMPVTDEGVKDFIATLIPEPAADVLTERQKENVREARMDVWDVLQGETVAPAHRRTAYGLFCAGVEYADHLRAYKNPTTYFERNVSYQPMKEKIAELAAACAKN